MDGVNDDKCLRSITPRLTRRGNQLDVKDARPILVRVDAVVIRCF